MVFTLEDLKKMAPVTREMILECAGNSRVFLVPQARGLQWDHGAVGNAKWTGVPLGAVLERAGVRPGAVDVVLTGTDKGAITSDPPSPGAINFERAVPLDKAKKDETLLAWEMNGEPLTASHGAPLRAVVGGWYGMASVKWLTNITVLARPHQGFFQTMDYSIWDRKKTITPQIVPITAIQPKAIITSHGAGAVLKANTKHTITGLAWAGENRVDKVELSIDGGKNWTEMQIENSAPFTWSSWSTNLNVGPARPEPLSLVVRATDNAKNTQPASRDPDRRSYMINHTVPVDVLVR
jgi:DMSO/TMAO reductase YedYZ molybdopterin-dependent catalytic subunit